MFNIICHSFYEKQKCLPTGQPDVKGDDMSKIKMITKRMVLAATYVLLTGLLLHPVLVLAMDEPEDTVSVAYIDYESFFSRDGDGEYSGYGVDYLNRIAKYTGWNYQFIDMDWPTAFQAVKNGEVDLYCVARVTEDRQSDFDFSLYSICDEQMNLYTLQSTDLYYEDFLAFDGIRIGMLESSGEIDYFEKYAEKHHFDYQLETYARNESAIEALKKGEVDAIALVNYSVTEPLKLIGNFGVSPAYIMGDEDSRYISELSEAQEQLSFDDPNFVDDLSMKYFSRLYENTDLLLTREETAYIKEAKPLNVAIVTNMAPIEYYNDTTKSYGGFTVDLYDRISDLTGLQFQFVKREEDDILLSQMEQGEIQIVGAMAQNPAVEQAMHLRQTRPFLRSSFSVVMRDDETLSYDSVVAISTEHPMFSGMAKKQGYKKLLMYDTAEDCVRAIYKKNADFTYIFSMCEGYLMNHVQYSDLHASVLHGTEYNISLGIYEENDERLLSILNKALTAIPEQEINKIMVSSTAMAEPKQTLGDFLTKNGILILVMGILVIVMLSMLVIRILRTRQQRELRNSLQQHHDFLQHLYDTIPCSIIQYSYDKPYKVLNCNAACVKIFGYEDDQSIIGEIPNSVISEEASEALQQKFEQCTRNAAPIAYATSITKRDRTEAYIECVMDIVETDQGKVFQEVFLDVTDRVLVDKRNEKRYLEELKRNGKRDEGLLFTACVDISDYILIQSDDTIEGIREGMSADDYLKVLKQKISELQTDQWIEDVQRQVTSKKLKESYEDGQVEKHFQCRWRQGEHIIWIRLDLILIHHPGTGHLLCFSYIYDITDDYMSGEIMKRVALENCDGFISIERETGHCMQYRVDDAGKLSRSETEYGKTDMISEIASYMNDNDREAFKLETGMENIAERLEEDANYQLYATIVDENGERQDKALLYFYIDYIYGILMVTITDVTAVRRSEVRHAELLSNALATAEEADAAKSQFLSRVSHEMRTPLNAIIGFIELAKGTDRETMENYMVSSDIAAKQLLSVINDVLDMSSIESGKMKIAQAPFNFKHLVSAITNIYGSQCKQKGIEYETKILMPTDEWLIGDELRINQILMNLLGNAVKFTDEGHIWLTISQKAEDEEQVFICFDVSDTGHGISSEMQERLFKPFEQESTTTARKYGGSGLGLSIVKNLIGMMDGTIRVESKLGEGTRFIVDIPFKKSNVGETLRLPDTVDKLHVMAIDDVKSELDYMSLILKRMKIRFTCASGGEEALRKMEQAQIANDPYNVCLIDWRMPEMNGLETTKRVRERYGNDVVVIIASAYDFHQMGESAKAAGANLLVSKPLFQSSLFDIFMTMTGGKIAQPKEEPRGWDFAGKRVLLVEDNELNQIVARGYLQKFNIVFDLAENGQVAVDKFLGSEPGYYNAILMDVQMPVMDGFEATKIIRESEHPEAKTIQIIAQTADAFNEDITRVLSAGMNAHVAKPIKPDLLAKALFKAFESV